MVRSEQTLCFFMITLILSVILFIKKINIESFTSNDDECSKELENVKTLLKQQIKIITDKRSGKVTEKFHNQCSEEEESPYCDSDTLKDSMAEFNRDINTIISQTNEEMLSIRNAIKENKETKQKEQETLNAIS